MKETFKKYLFDKNILVNDGAEEKDEELESLLCTALMAKYGYNVVSGAELMSKPVLNYVAEQIRYIAKPTEPFYKGFPESVKNFAQKNVYLTSSGLIIKLMVLEISLKNNTRFAKVPLRELRFSNLLRRRT